MCAVTGNSVEPRNVSLQGQKDRFKGVVGPKTIKVSPRFQLESGHIAIPVHGEKTGCRGFGSPYKVYVK